MLALAYNLPNVLKATASGTLHRPPRDADGDSPLAAGRSFIEPLAFDGSSESPDEFDVRKRIPLDFSEDSPQRAGKRAKKLEELLDEHSADLERIEQSDAGSDSATDGNAKGGGRT